MKRIFLILAFSLLVGCSKAPSMPVSARSLTASDVSSFMFTNGFGSGYVADSSYDLPEQGYLEYDFSRALLQTYLDNGWQYSPNAWDCDKFALEAVSLMHRQHYTARKTANGIAFGELWYRRWAGGYHAINFGLLDVGGQTKIMFYEPQSFEPARLNSEEMRSVIFWKL